MATKRTIVNHEPAVDHDAAPPKPRAPRKPKAREPKSKPTRATSKEPKRKPTPGRKRDGATVAGVELGDMRFREMPLSELRPADYNPRRISEEARAGLAASLTRFGCVEPVIWNERTGRVVGGHQRLRVMLDLGMESTVVVVVSLSDDAEKALNITLNNPKTQGEFTEGLSAILAELADSAELGGALGDLCLEGLDESLGLALAGLEGEDDDGGEDAGEDESGKITHRFDVVIECETEAEQLELIERFQEEGLRCRALTV